MIPRTYPNNQRDIVPTVFSLQSLGLSGVTVDLLGFEPRTYCLQSNCSSSWSYRPKCVIPASLTGVRVTLTRGSGGTRTHKDWLPSRFQDGVSRPCDSTSIVLAQRVRSIRVSA